jgi:hypothetical protein
MSQNVKGHFRAGKWIPAYSRQDKREGGISNYLISLFEDEDDLHNGGRGGDSPDDEEEQSEEIL